MSARERGKSFERRVADLLGGQRVPQEGAKRVDVIVPRSAYNPETKEIDWSRVTLVIEAKRVDEAGIRGAWLEQAQAHGRRHRKPWALVKARKGSPRSTTTIDTELAIELFRLAGLAP
jgi:hypothetical protein